MSDQILQSVFAIPKVQIEGLPTFLQLSEPMPFSRSVKPFREWSMETDDAPILRYLFRQMRSQRHLEFGTWQGFGTLLALEESPATVWTINLLNGEPSHTPDSAWSYGEPFDNQALANDSGLATAARWAIGARWDEQRTFFQTDAFGFIGRLYRERGLGHRVCQIFCDSKEWDSSNFPSGFFDTIFVDGGHSPDVVISDTRKALPLLRRGGLLLWHDFCPEPDLMKASPVAEGVAQGIAAVHDEILAVSDRLAWIFPSMLLVARHA